MKIEVKVDEVSLDSVVGDRTVNIDGDREPVTLAEMVARMMLDRILRERNADDSLYGSTRARIKAITDEEIRAAIQPQIARALDGPIAITNEFGRPVGEPKPLAELIVSEAREFLSKPADRYGTEGTVLRKMIREAVEGALKKELAEALTEEKAKVVAAMRAKAAELIADTIKAGVGR